MTAKDKDFTIILLPAFLFLGIIALNILCFKREISIWIEVDYLFIVTYIIWIILESGEVVEINM